MSSSEQKKTVPIYFYYLAKLQKQEEQRGFTTLLRKKAEKSRCSVKNFALQDVPGLQHELHCAHNIHIV